VIAGCQVTPTGLIIQGELSQDDWQDVGNQLAQIGRCLMWCIGDWLLAGEDAGYLPRGKLDEAATLFGIEYDVARDAAYVARQFESARRLADLTYGHHRAVANHPEADELLTWAADTGATVRDLREEKKRRKLLDCPLPEPDPIPAGLELDRIICGDNCEILAGFPSDCIDLVVTSPPYDDLRTYGGHDWNFEGVASELLRVLKHGGVLVWVVADQVIDGGETGSSFRQALHFQDIGFRIHDTMIYKTNKPPTGGKRYQHCWEYMFVFSLGEPRVFNPIRVECTWAGYKTSPTQRNREGELVGGRRRTIGETKLRDNIWHYDTGSGKTDKTRHPASFPLQLAADHIITWTNEVDVVADPFVGSGTTCRAAKDAGRHWVGIEVNPDYCQIARKRLAQEVLRTA
jgi:site-specific DNA-methyltransferase (adenine-specific)